MVEGESSRDGDMVRLGQTLPPLPPSSRDRSNAVDVPQIIVGPDSARVRTRGARRRKVLHRCYKERQNGG